MKTTQAARTVPSPPEPRRKAVLIVALSNFDVRYASPLAITWLDYPIDRLLGRSLMLSVPPLGQALTLAVAHGLSQLPTPLGVAMVNPDGARLMVSVHQVGADAVIDFVLADGQDTSADAPKNPTVSRSRGV